MIIPISRSAVLSARMGCRINPVSRAFSVSRNILNEGNKVNDELSTEKNNNKENTNTQINKEFNADLEKALEELAQLKLATADVSQPSEETIDTSKLIDTFENTYNPKVLTEEVIAPDAKSPVPINAQLNYYAPLKHDVKYGHLKAEVVFKCFDPVNAEFFSDFALRAAYYLGLPATGPKPIPTKRERWTVIRAPFVHAKSKENFERKTHGRIIKIWDADSEVIDTWLAYLKKNSVWGVGVKVNMYTNQSLDETANKTSEIQIEEINSLSDLSTTMKSVSNNNSSPVSQKVMELLNDPIFTRHMTKEEIDRINEKEA